MCLTDVEPCLVLASASPRRLDLLRQIAIIPTEVVPADVDETLRRGELPAPYALRLAQEKAHTVAARYPGCFVIGADTVVACGRRVVPKPETVAEAGRCLALLSGRGHRVYSGVTIVSPDGRTVQRLVTTVVGFKRLDATEMADYLASGEWSGKAGGYAIQGRAAAFVSKLCGSYTNVVGLPLFETANLLKGIGWRGR